MALKSSKVAIEVVIKDIKKIADLKKGLKELRAEQKKQEASSKTGQFQSKKNAKAYKERAAAIKFTSKQLRELNKDMAGATKATKAATKSNNGMAKQFIKGAAAIGVIVGAFRMVSRVISSVVSTFSEFEFVMAKVNAVSGATDDQFKALTKTAEELGRTTFFTATQVGELMLNYSKLGFSSREIQAAVKPTLDLATATGSDLARSATVAGAAVRGFGLDASETERVVDVMAVAFASSAMDIEKWQTSMTKVAPIAKAAGFSIEDTAAIMSKLTDAGIEASIAGTSLRNILLKMQDPASDLSQAFGGTISSLDELVPAMKKFSDEGGDLADIMQVVDIRQAAAFEQMITSADATVKLRDELKLAAGEAKKMADIIGNTMQGSFLKFTSAIQGLSIALMKDFAAGFQKSVESMSKFFNILAENSETITKIINGILRLAKGFMAGYAAQKLLTGALFLGRAAMVAYASLTGTAVVMTEAFALSLTKLKLAIARTGFGILLIGLAEIATRFMFATEKADEFNATTQDSIDLETKLSNIREGYNAKMNKQYAKTLKQSEEDIKLLDSKITLAKSAYFAAQNGVTKLTKNEKDAHAEGIERLETRMKLEIKNKNQIIAKDLEEANAKRDLITIQETALKNAQEIVTTNKKDLIAKNKLIKSIEKKISTLKELGVEEEKVNKEKEKNTDADWERVNLMKTVLSGARELEEAERILRDLAIERAQTELDAIPIGVMSGNLRLELEEKIIALKLKNRKETEKGAKADEKSLEKSVKAYSDLGSSLIEVAGENEKLNGIRKAGEAITKAAAIAESILNLEKAISVVTEGKLTIAKLLGIKATIAGTSATLADTIATVVGIIPKAISAILSAAAAIPFPFNILAGIATWKFLKKAQKFEEGGVVSDGDKFADGGMVHGASHAQGGVKFAVGGRVNELEGGEAVINKRSTAMFRNQLSSMNQAGGGVKFADGGLMSSPSFTESSFAASNQSAMMGAMGGQRKVVVVEADITDSQSTVSVIQANATF